MEIEQALRNYIINARFDERAPKNFDDDYDLIDSGTIDSLFMMELINHIEQQYQIEFGLNDLVPKYFRSVNRLAGFVKTKLKVEATANVT